MARMQVNSRNDATLTGEDGNDNYCYYCRDYSSGLDQLWAARRGVQKLFHPAAAAGTEQLAYIYKYDLDCPPAIIQSLNYCALLWLMVTQQLIALSAPIERQLNVVKNPDVGHSELSIRKLRAPHPLIDPLVRFRSEFSNERAIAWS